MTPKRTCNVAIVGQCSCYKYGIYTIIEKMPGYHVHSMTTNGQHLLEILSLRKEQPDIVITEVRMPVMNAYELLPKLKTQQPNVKVIVLTERCGDYCKHFMLQHGAATLLAKANAITHMDHLLQEVAENGYYYSDICTDTDFKNIKKTTLQKYQALSDRQKELFHHITHGLSNKQIASSASITISTVETYQNQICKKLGLATKAEILQFALDNEIC